MKLHSGSEAHHGKSTSHTFTQKITIAIIVFLLFPIITLLFSNPLSPLRFPGFSMSISRRRSKCDVYSGKWLPHPDGPYYTNMTCNLIIPQQDCIKLGRPDREFMKWRWKPDGCELPPFSAAQFLELVRGKSMAFVGDSVGRNQMQSLLCLLASVGYPVDLTAEAPYRETKRYLYEEYNFTLAAFWAPYLVEAKEGDPNGPLPNTQMKLYLDKADSSWASQIETFDIIIFSAGQWFFRPLIYYENDEIIGCYDCGLKNMKNLTMFHGYRMAFRTAFRTLRKLKDYKGMALLRTFSPAHFENGTWDKGGSCPRTMPIKKEDMKVEYFVLEMYLTQVEELRAAEREGRKMGLKFRLLDITEAMVMRPDGHPNHYLQVHNKNVTMNDCVHWCLPGPIDTWNEFLLYLLRMEHGRSSY